MEYKTQVRAGEGQQDILITRVFELPAELLFKAHTEADIVAQWMNTKVVQLENKRHGSWQYETSDPQGNVVFRANGVFHEFEPPSKITRTFEMENTSFPVQLEFLTFTALTDETSQLDMQIIFKSGTFRDQMLKMPFAYGLNMAHNKLEAFLLKK